MKIGHPLPEISWTENGKEINAHSLAGRPVVVFFYPKDFSPVCTKQVCAFGDNYSAFSAFDAQIIGVSKDSNQSHEKFSQQHALPFPLISDPKAALYKRFKVGKILGLQYNRETFVFDREHKLIGKHTAMLEGKNHTRKALEILKNHTS